MALITIVFCIAFTSQPLSMNSTASQSSSSGCTGNSPCAPKSSTVLTMPKPKYDCQKRFTVTRAVSGLARSTSQRARPRRSFGHSGARRGENLRQSRRDLLAGRVVGAALEQERVARRRHCRPSPSRWESWRRIPCARAAAPPVRRAPADLGRRHAFQVVRGEFAGCACVRRVPGSPRSADRFAHRHGGGLLGVSARL